MSKDSISQCLDDFKILKDIMHNKINIKDLNIDLEKRLITLCNNRVNQINQEIISKDLEISKLQKLI